MARPHLFRWYRHWQLDSPCRGGWLSLGVDWSQSRWPRPVAYWSPDATPVNPAARGLGAEPRR